MAALRRFDVDAIHRDHPLTEVVAGCGIELRPSGRAWIGLCPFHDDRSPSLYVYPDSDRWWCFACREGGDNIQFVCRIDSVDFVTACRKLEGLPIVPRDEAAPVHSGQAQPKRSRSERRWDRLRLDEQIVMNTTGAFYRDALWREPRALDYVRSRGIPDGIIQRCAIGYADGRSLEMHLGDQSETAEGLGLLRRRDAAPQPEMREFFGGRILVPEIRGGDCIWFIGRTLDQRSERIKYLALSGERPVLGLEAAAGQREVFLCEGVFDWLTAISWNLAAFSPCGTHLPADRLGFLARSRIVWGVLDGDEAGRAAASGFAAQLGDRFVPIHLPDGCDLNDLGRNPGGKREFFRLLLKAKGESWKAESTHLGGDEEDYIAYVS